MRGVMGDHDQLAHARLAQLQFEERAGLPVPGQRVAWPEALDIAADPNLAEIIHPFDRDHHGAMRIAEQVEVRPDGCAGDRVVSLGRNAPHQGAHQRYLGFRGINRSLLHWKQDL